jgi:hypothetical protein
VALAAALRGNRSLHWLWLAGNALADAGGRALAAALVENSTLRGLDLRRNRLPAGALLALAAALAHPRPDGHAAGLCWFDLGGNPLSDELLVVDEGEGASPAAIVGAALAVALLSNRALRELRLCRSSLGDAGAAALAGPLASPAPPGPVRQGPPAPGLRPGLARSQLAWRAAGWHGLSYSRPGLHRVARSRWRRHW